MYLIFTVTVAHDEMTEFIMKSKVHIHAHLCVEKINESIVSRFIAKKILNQKETHMSLLYSLTLSIIATQH